MTIFSINSFLNSHKPKNNSFYTIAIDGRGGSGKTAFAEYLKTLLPEFVFLNGDDYFEPVENQIVWGAFNDVRLNKEIIEPLKSGNSFEYKRYDWRTNQYISNSKTNVEKGFCLERCYAFAMDLDWDLKIWVETPPSICLQRGLMREHMPKERVLRAWNEVWQPEEDKYIQKNKPLEIADTVIDGTKPFEHQLVK